MSFSFNETWWSHIKFQKYWKEWTRHNADFLPPTADGTKLKTKDGKLFVTVTTKSDDSSKTEVTYWANKKRPIYYVLETDKDGLPSTESWYIEDTEMARKLHTGTPVGALTTYANMHPDETFWPKLPGNLAAKIFDHTKADINVPVETRGEDLEAEYYMPGEVDKDF